MSKSTPAELFDIVLGEFEREGAPTELIVTAIIDGQPFVWSIDCDDYSNRPALGRAFANLIEKETA